MSSKSSNDVTQPSVSAAGDPKANSQAAYDALKIVFDQATAAFENPHNSDEVQDAALATKQATYAQMTLINQNLLETDTIDLAAAEDALSPGIKDLEELKDRLEKINTAIADVGSIVAGLAKAISLLNAI